MKFFVWGGSRELPFPFLTVQFYFISHFLCCCNFKFSSLHFSFSLPLFIHVILYIYMFPCNSFIMSSFIFSIYTFIIILLSVHYNVFINTQSIHTIFYTYFYMRGIPEDIRSLFMEYSTFFIFYHSPPPHFFS